MYIHELKRKTPNAKALLVGRGGKRGKTSGRGTKGQRAHGGHGIRPEFRDIIKRIPKLRGHGKNRSRTVNSGRAKATALNVSFLEKAFEKGDVVNPMVLAERSLIQVRGNKMPTIKILATGDLTKALTIEGCVVSPNAKIKIEKAGGSIA